MKKTELSVKHKVFAGKKLYFYDFGSEEHGKPSFILWIDPRLIQKVGDEEVIYLPLENVKLVMIDENLILTQGNLNLFKIFKECGFRGRSNIEVVSPYHDILKYRIFHSPLGSTGISEGALVFTDQNYVIFKWERTGRLYGKPSKGLTIVYLDGTEEEIENINDITELEKLQKFFFGNESK